MPSLIDSAIEHASRGTAPGSKDRMKALARVRWLLASDDGRFVAHDAQVRAVLVNNQCEAIIYDGRDNEQLKCRFMESLLGVPLTVVLLED